MKYGEKTGEAKILGIDVEIFSNEDTFNINETFHCNSEGVKLGMNHQCVQLARIFYYKITGKDSYIICPDLNATCWFRYRKELNLEEKLYSEIEEGDLVIFEGGEYGHIAIVTKVDEKGFFLIQQNFFNDYRDVDFYISFDDLKKNLPLIDQNNTEYNITDFLRINKVFDKISK